MPWKCILEFWIWPSRPYIMCLELVRLVVRSPKFSCLPYPSAAAQENPTAVEQGTCQPAGPAEGPANQRLLISIPFTIQLDYKRKAF